MSTLQYSKETTTWNLTHCAPQTHKDVDLGPFNCETNSIDIYSCKICDYTTHMNAVIGAHVKRTHLGETNTEIITRKYKCKTCDFETHSSLIWCKHVLSKNCVLNNTDKGYSTKYKQHREHIGLHQTIERQWFQCDKCEYTTNRKCHFNTHTKYQHSEDHEIERFQCDKCGYKTKREPDLNTHINHKGLEDHEIKRFQCDKCQYKTTHKELTTNPCWKSEQDEFFNVMPMYVGNETKCVNTDYIYGFPTKRELGLEESIKRQPGIINVAEDRRSPECVSDVSDDDPTDHPSDITSDTADMSERWIDSPICGPRQDLTISEETSSKQSVEKISSKICDKISKDIISSDEVENLGTIACSAPKGVKQIRTKDFCFYCETEVLNFARHISRNHSQEFEVQKILSLSPKSPDRKRLITSLRKKGNHLRNSSCLYKPMHKSLINNSEEHYVPCPFCYGLYSRRLLWRHKKHCSEKSGPDRKWTLGEAQNMLIPKLSVGVDLQQRVFPRMQADKVSLCVKGDPLICAFGSRYLSTHREQHHALICSRRMRELGKVLIESRKLQPVIKGLYELLHPQYFDVVVQSAKTLAKYNPETDVYESPTFGMNISRSLKDCCDIAILNIYKGKYKCSNVSTAEAEITAFKGLLETTWKHEISSQAGNKITVVPLAADLKLFRVYLIQKGSEAERTLKENMENMQGFVSLMESIFCRLLLLNGKRIGDLQRIKLSAYLAAEAKSDQSYEEFSAEKKLLKSFKRVVIRGKRGRGLPVLFSNDIQEHMKLFLHARSNFVQNSNPFLFGHPNSYDPIAGYKIMQKHAKLSGAKNPEALTSTKLRKHLATITQIFNMSNGDVERLATFTGHGFPDDVYRTAQIAKLLMLMERGDDIDEDIELQGDGLTNVRGEISDAFEEEPFSPRLPPPKSKNAKYVPKRQLVPWTSQQKKVVSDFFRNHVESKRPPKRSECEELKAQHPDLLSNKSWTKIKVFIQNVYTKKLKH